MSTISHARPVTTRGEPYKLPPTKLTRLGWFGWGYHVVPTTLLRDLLLQHFADREEWKEQFYFDVAAIMRVEQKIVARRMRDVWTLTSKVIKVTHAEAACAAIGLDLDTDTDIPTLPGTMPLAKEMIELRAEEAGVSLDDMELQRMVRQTMRICALIIGYPHNTQRLLDLAPFNCLRPFHR